MHDKRVHRGNSYAAMVIPAGTSHDTMVMEKRQTQKAQSLRRRTFKSTAKVSLGLTLSGKLLGFGLLMSLTAFSVIFKLDSRAHSTRIPQQRHPLPRARPRKTALVRLDR